MYKGLLDLIPREIVKENEAMKGHTTFKIGGPVDIMVFPRNGEDIKKVLSYCRQRDIPWLVFGLGSNLLVRDRGFRGVAIKIGNSLKEIKFEREMVRAQAGIRLSELSRQALAHSLSGLEFAEGIPGSLGGAIVMNAGAYGGEMRDVAIAVVVITPQGKEKILPAEELGFAYRKSIFQQQELLVVSALMKLTPGNPEEIRSCMREYASQRREKQPIEYPSAGSVFKRPPGVFVGPLIEKLGLKGYRIGGAQISTKHAGFIINVGGATADDVLRLIGKVQIDARQKLAIELEPEIRIVGE